MGALHEGHISLIEAAGRDNDIVVCSVFVNLTQFNNAEDLAKYPRTFDEDRAMLEKAGCSAMFAPSVQTKCTPDQPELKINFGELETVMEGASRPGHFNGVGIVVSKPFNIVKPNRAYFRAEGSATGIGGMFRLVTGTFAFALEPVICPTASRNGRLGDILKKYAP